MIPASPLPSDVTSDEALATVARALRAYHDDPPAGDERDRHGNAWDVAGMVWRWVPLTPDWEAREAGFDWSPERRGARLRLFCDAYGLSPAERHALLSNVEERIQAAVDAATDDDEREQAMRSAWHVPELREAWEPYLE